MYPGRMAGMARERVYGPGVCRAGCQSESLRDTVVDLSGSNEPQASRVLVASTLDREGGL